MKVKNTTVDIWGTLKKYNPELVKNLTTEKWDGFAFSQQAFYGNTLAEIILLGCTVKAAGQVNREVRVAPHGKAWIDGKKDSVILFDPELPVQEEAHHRLPHEPTIGDIIEGQTKQ